MIQLTNVVEILYGITIVTVSGFIGCIGFFIIINIIFLFQYHVHTLPDEHTETSYC